MTVCMPSFKPNHGLKLWFPLELHDGGSEEEKTKIVACNICWPNV